MNALLLTLAVLGADTEPFVYHEGDPLDYNRVIFVRNPLEKRADPRLEKPGPGWVFRARLIVAAEKPKVLMNTNEGRKESGEILVYQLQNRGGKTVKQYHLLATDRDLKPGQRLTGSFYVACLCRTDDTHGRIPFAVLRTVPRDK